MGFVHAQGVDKREAQKRVQVEQDRRLAQKIVLDEARQKGIVEEKSGSGMAPNQRSETGKTPNQR